MTAIHLEPLRPEKVTCRKLSPRNLTRGLRSENNWLLQNVPIKQTGLWNSASFLKEGRAEPHGNLRKDYTERTERCLPFDAAYGCTGSSTWCTAVHFSLCYTFFVHGRAPLLITYLNLSHSNTCSRSQTQPGGGSSWAYQPYLPLKSESK